MDQVKVWNGQRVTPRLAAAAFAAWRSFDHYGHAIHRIATCVGVLGPTAGVP